MKIRRFFRKMTRMTREQLLSFVKSSSHFLLDLLYPRRCPVCLSALPPGKTLICPPCVKRIRYVVPPVCYKCGKPLSDETRELCRNCKKRLPSFEEGISWAEYTSDYTRRIMNEVKYHGDPHLLDFPCEDLLRRQGSHIRKWGAEALIPVPLHRKRLLERGYNQAEEIAARLSPGLGIPVDASLLLRKAETKAQKALTSEGRAMNLMGAFQASRPSPYRRVILIDDIYTTGATAEACTRTLLRAGAEEVFFLSLAIGHDDSRESPF